MTTQTFTSPAPAKVNLTLDVFPPRADGFHDLDSLVATFLPADEVTVTLTVRDEDTPSRIRLTCNDPSLPGDRGNLAYRAAEAFGTRFLPETGLDMHLTLTKRLPAQAGLGGGSSDAAAVLRLLAKYLLRQPATHPAVLEVAASVGSDVPLFLFEGPVRMRGRGERVEPLPVPLPPLYGVIVRPAVGVPTGPAYAALDAIPDRTPGSTTPRLLAALAGGAMDARALAPLLHNDFEAAVLPAYPEVAAVHRALTDAGALRALLCGSGSAVFGLAANAANARGLAATLSSRFPFVAVATPYGDNHAG